jgi:hypothetical protein
MKGRDAGSEFAQDASPAMSTHIISVNEPARKTLIELCVAITSAQPLTGLAKHHVPLNSSLAGKLG